MKKPTKRKASKSPGLKFGGRSTAVGVGYEAHVSAYIAAKMLGGNACIVWNGISGGDIAAITMQDNEPVDDVVVTLCGELRSKVFISAKHRASAIAMTAKSAAFTDVISSFVRQFIKLKAPLRKGSRLMWAVPSSAGASMTQDLLKVLETFRADASTSLEDFLQRRQTRERKAMGALIAQTKRAWKSATKKNPTQRELHKFVKMVHVGVFDFGVGLHHEQTAEGAIRSLVAIKPSESHRIWEKLELHFNQADRQGLLTTAASLRQMLVADGLKLKATPAFADDVELLRRMTARNLDRLKDHTLLRFSKTEIHIKRTDELSAMLVATKHDHLLVTGEPGSGKSGLLHPLCETLNNEGTPVVLLLAEEVFGRDWKGSANLPGLTHPLDDVLGNWPNGGKGVLITDALDAVRDVETQRVLRSLLHDVQRGASGWTVVASVREFDLKHGRELRESFPGTGVVGHCSKEFTGVSHFHVTGLTEPKLDELVSNVTEIGQFIASARSNPRSGGIHRSPFFLRLAAELLKDGVSPARLADWNSPAILLRRFWRARVDGAGANDRRVSLQNICRRMAQLRSMTLSIQEVSLSSSELNAVDELRSRGIFQSPILRHGSPAGEDELRFSHHLIHDYAIARSLIPSVSVRFADFTTREPLLPIFYRQSFLFALEELWDGPDGSAGFWQSAFRMESIAQLHGITRILAPILAARRVDTFADLEPLLSAVKTSTSEDSPAEKALRHMASGLQDTDVMAIRAGAGAWCSFVADVSRLLPSRPSLETPVVHVLSRLNAVSNQFDTKQLRDLNTAARNVLAHHVSKEVSRGWRYAACATIETICKTFSLAAHESEEALLSILTPQRLAHFPHWDLFDFAHSLKFLNDSGDSVVLSLFVAAFSTEPKAGEWENFGGAILPLRMQSSDNWNSIHYSLAEYYESRLGTNAWLMTAIACIAWNSTVRRRGAGSASHYNGIKNIMFRGAECELIEDAGHIWDRDHEHEENRILSHFETLLDSWAAAGDMERLRHAIDALVARNRTSLMWVIFMETGAKYPTTLGRELAPLLIESLFLTHPDYSYGGISLFAALHKTGDDTQREQLEKLVLDLPNTAHFLRGDEPRDPVPSWLEHAQNKLLGALDDTRIVLPTVQFLRKERSEEKPLPMNRAREHPRVTSYTLSEEEMVERRGISLKDPTNVELLRLRDLLKPFRDQEGSKFDIRKAEQNWAVIIQCERAVHRHHKKHSKMADELWGYLVSSCESIARHADWPATSERWRPVRRILLKASTHSSPKKSENEDAMEDKWPNWEWPAPRLDAARGLLFIVFRLGKTDPAITAALVKLSRDKSHPVRFNMGDRLAVLEDAAPELMWQLIDRFIRYEKRLSVLEMVVRSLDHLWAGFKNDVRSRLARIATIARLSPKDKNHIHETLVNVHLFRFLRTGDAECECFINNVISECDGQRSCHAIGPQLHACRAGNWLTAGDAVKVIEPHETVRKRTWAFFEKLLSAAQTKLKHHRTRLEELHATGHLNTEEGNATKEAIKHTTQLVDGIAMQLYFASGAHADEKNKEKDHLTDPKKRRFWTESANLFHALSEEIHPHTVHQAVETLHHLLPCAPRDVFLTAARAIISSSAAGYQHESLAVKDVVKLIQRALADHRDIFQSIKNEESECLAALLKVLDLFVEAGWSDARQLTHRLEEIYR